MSTPNTPTIPASFHDLLGANITVIATVGPDGRPQVSAIWFLAEGETIRTSLNTSRQKFKNLRANPAVTFFIHDPKNVQRYLEVRGDAEITDDPDYEFADRLGRKYGADVRNFDGDNAHRVVVTVHPTRVNAVDMSAH